MRKLKAGDAVKLPEIKTTGIGSISKFSDEIYCNNYDLDYLIVQSVLRCPGQENMIFLKFDEQYSTARLMSNMFMESDLEFYINK